LRNGPVRNPKADARMDHQRPLKPAELLLDQPDVSETNELQSRAFHPPQGSLVDKAL